MMSLSTKDSQTEDDEEGNFYLFRCFLAAAQLVFLRRGKFILRKTRESTELKMYFISVQK